MTRRTVDFIELGQDLIEAAKIGDIEKLSRLIEKVDVNYTDENGRTALHFAAYNGEEKSSKHLLDSGANIDIKDSVRGNTALQFAAAEKYPQIIELLIARGADVDYVDKDGNNALFHAIKAGNMDCIKQLIGATKNLDVKNVAGSDAFDLARLYDLREVTALLEISKLFQDKDFPVDRHDLMYCKFGEEKNSALHFAAQNGKVEMIDYLLENGAIINAGNDNGETALILAAKEGYLEAIETLIEKLFKEPDENGLNYGDYNGRTALHWAADKGHEEVYDLLIENGARTDFEDKDEKTAADLMAQHSQKDPSANTEPIYASLIDLKWGKEK